MRIKTFDRGGDSGHEPGSSVGRNLLSESVCDAFASLSAHEVYEAMKAFPIKKSTITSCDIHYARPLRRFDAFWVSKIIRPASQGNYMHRT